MLGVDHTELSPSVVTMSTGSRHCCAHFRDGETENEHIQEWEKKCVFPKCLMLGVFYRLQDHIK